MDLGSKLAEYLRQGADTLTNLPTEAQRFITNPQAFTQLVTGKNPLPKETGFVAGATGLPAKNPVQGGVLNPASAPYQEGYEQGEPVGYAGMALPFAAPAAVATAKALAPKVGQMAKNYMINQGFMPSIVPQEKKSIQNVYEGAMPHYTQQENLANVFENAGLKVKESGSSLSNSKYVEIVDPLSGEVITARFANHPQSGQAMTLLGPADIEIGDIFKYKSWNEAVNPILERINKSRKDYGDELLTIKEKILEENAKPIARKELIQQQIDKIE